MGVEVEQPNPKMVRSNQRCSTNILSQQLSGFFMEFTGDLLEYFSNIFTFVHKNLHFPFLKMDKTHVGVREIL